MTPVLGTDRLILRAPTLADAPSWHEHFADFAVIGDLAEAVPWPYPADGVPRFLATLGPELGESRWLWGLFLRQAPDRLIGIIDLRRHGRSHRGFWLGRAYWGRGLMMEAVTATTDCAFNRLGFATLVLNNAVGNFRSRRIKEKSNAKFLRVEPGHFANPDYTEREVWELTRADWQARLIPPAPG